MTLPSVLLDSQTLKTYADKTPKSAQSYREARTTFPSGITHDVRFLLPHPLCIEYADMGNKWDGRPMLGLPFSFKINK